MSRKPLTVTLPRSIAQEMADIAALAQRSTAFIALRAVTAAPEAAGAAPTEATEALALVLDEDDPANTLTKLKAAAKGRSLDEAVAAAWVATRERFVRWAEREAAARASERADDLDEGLRAAADPATTAARLFELGASPYPRIRALVAAHPATPQDVLGRLAEDREPYVREAVQRRT